MCPVDHGLLSCFVLVMVSNVNAHKFSVFVAVVVKTVTAYVHVEFHAAISLATEGRLLMYLV